MSIVEQSQSTVEQIFNLCLTQKNAKTVPLRTEYFCGSYEKLWLVLILDIGKSIYVSARAELLYDRQVEAEEGMLHPALWSRHTTQFVLPQTCYFITLQHQRTQTCPDCKDTSVTQGHRSHQALCLCNYDIWVRMCDAVWVKQKENKVRKSRNSQHASQCLCKVHAYTIIFIGVNILYFRGIGLQKCLSV